MSSCYKHYSAFSDCSCSLSFSLSTNLIDNYNFYDCDKDGNGEALELQKINVNEDGNVELEFDTNYGDYFQCSELSSLITSERLYVLEMLENIIAYSEEENIPVLKEDEDFDDYEDENCRI